MTIRSFVLIAFLTTITGCFGPFPNENVRDTPEYKERHAREAAEAAEKKRLEENRKNDPELMEESACESLRMMKKMQRSIDYQKYLGQKSGYVDAGSIYESTQMIEMQKSVLADLKDNYKKVTKTKMKLPPKGCDLKNLD